MEMILGFIFLWLVIGMLPTVGIYNKPKDLLCILLGPLAIIWFFYKLAVDKNLKVCDDIDWSVKSKLLETLSGEKNIVFGLRKDGTLCWKEEE